MAADGIRARTDTEVTESVAARFWAKVNKTDDCWLWTGADRGNGYGCLKVGRKIVSAHCLSFALHFGPIPAGNVVCHKCDVRACVRPDHLFAGTYLDNVQDMDAKGRRVCRRGEGHPRCVLTSDVVLQARSMKARGISGRKIAAFFGVAYKTIDCAIRGQSWAHLSEC
jgi:hypothetical protein